MFAPSLANSSTMALPIPLLPPVTMATLFVKSMTDSFDGCSQIGSVLRSRRNPGTLFFLFFLALTPVNASFIATIQNLNQVRFGEIAPSPIDKGFNTYPYARHQQCVYSDPSSKRDKPVELMPLLADRCDGRVAPDHRHDSLVVVVKWSSRLTGDFGQNVLRSPHARLLGHRTQLRQQLVAGAGNVGEVAQNVNARKAFHGEIRSHFDPTAVPSGQAGIGGERGRHEPTRPHHRPGLNRGAVGEQHMIGPYLLHADSHF